MPARLSPSPPEPDYFPILREFCRRAGFKRPDPPVKTVGTELEKAVQDEIDKWAATLPPGDDGPARLRKVASTGVSLGERAFPMHDMGSKIVCAMYTALLLAVDDLPEITLKTSPYLTCMPRLMSGSNQKPEHSLLSLFAHYSLERSFDHFHPYGANEIGLGFLGFIMGCYLEVRGKDIELASPTNVDKIAIHWPEFLRRKTGIALPFAFMIFPPPAFPDVITHIKAAEDITWFVNTVNDIISFHKEQLAGERANYMWGRARVLGSSINEALVETIEKALTAGERVDALLKDHPLEYQYWKVFQAGYIDFHLDHPRYHLKDLKW